MSKILTEEGFEKLKNYYDVLKKDLDIKQYNGFVEMGGNTINIDVLGKVQYANLEGNEIIQQFGEKYGIDFSDPSNVFVYTNAIEEFTKSKDVHTEIFQRPDTKEVRAIVNYIDENTKEKPDWYKFGFISELSSLGHESLLDVFDAEDENLYTALESKYGPKA